MKVTRDDFTAEQLLAIDIDYQVNWRLRIVASKMQGRRLSVSSCVSNAIVEKYNKYGISGLYNKDKRLSYQWREGDVTPEQLRSININKPTSFYLNVVATAIESTQSRACSRFGLTSGTVCHIVKKYYDDIRNIIHPIYFNTSMYPSQLREMPLVGSLKRDALIIADYLDGSLLADLTSKYFCSRLVITTACRRYKNGNLFYKYPPVPYPHSKITKALESGLLNYQVADRLGIHWTTMSRLKRFYKSGTVPRSHVDMIAKMEAF